MNGIEIVSQSNIYEVDTCWWILPLCIIVSFLVGAILCIIAWITCGFDSYYIMAVILSTAFGVLIGIFGTGLSAHDTDIIDYVEYKVIISDNVSLNEFNERYKIIDQEGKIYTVRER